MKRQTKSLESSSRAMSKARRPNVCAQDITQLMLRDHKPLKKLIKVMKNDGSSMRDVRASFEEFAGLPAYTGSRPSFIMEEWVGEFSSLLFSAYLPVSLTLRRPTIRIRCRPVWRCFSIRRGWFACTRP